VKFFFDRTLMLSATALFFTAILPPPAEAARVITSTIIKNRFDTNDPITWGFGATNRISVTVKNLSDSAQSIRIKIDDIKVHSVAGFETAAAGASDLPSWGTPSGPTTREMDKSLSPAIFTITLPARESTTAEWSLFCPSTDSFPCQVNEAGIIPVANFNIRSMTYVSSFSITVSVDEDRGALLSDITSQLLLFSSKTYVGPASTRALNGGRPF
jgi:hypothetical protein